MSVGLFFLRSAWDTMIGEMERDTVQLQAGLQRALTNNDYAAAGLYQAKLSLAEEYTAKVKATVVIATWDDWHSAYEWAVEIGAQPNVYAARNSLKNLVEERFGGAITADKAGAVKYAFYQKQLLKAGTCTPVAA